MFRLAGCSADQLHRCAAAMASVDISISLDSQCHSQATTLEFKSEALEIVTDESVDDQATDGAHATNEVVEIGREISGRIRRSLQGAREKTEDAVLAVCDHVTKLVEIARQGNEEAECTLHTIVGPGAGVRFDDEETSIAEVVHTQADSVNSFVADTREFFNQQIAIGDAASKSCQEMQLCVAQVVKLVFSSEILAYNIQIESARLGDDGRAFTVLGDEMVRFSSKVRDANIAIQSSLKLVSETMRKFQEQSKAMDQRLDTFTEQLRRKMDDVQLRTSKLTDSLHLTLERITHRNQEVIACSQDALSELQFQDPLAQRLMRIEMEVERLELLIETGTCDSFTNLEVNPCIGKDGLQNREPGVVDLF
jgi:gas vesicle protein